MTTLGAGTLGSGTLGAPVPALTSVTAHDYAGITDLGQRFSTIRFDLLDATNRKIGEIHPDADRAPTVEVRTESAVMRTLRGLALPWTEAIDVDTLAHRVRPVWVFADGTEHPLSVFLFADENRPRHSHGLDLVCDLTDFASVLDEPAETATGYSAGANVGLLIAAEWGASGYDDWTVEHSGAVLAEPLAFPVEASRLSRMIALSTRGGYLNPYIDNHGQGHSRVAVDPALAAADHVYDAGKTTGRAYPGTIVESTDWLTAPNRFLVVSTSAADTPIKGTWDVPATAPHSYRRRGRYITRTVRVAGLVDDAQAASVAMTEGLKAQQFAFAEFAAAPDPRHDTYDVVQWLGDNYLELGWRLPLQEGSAHLHRLRRAYA